MEKGGFGSNKKFLQLKKMTGLLKTPRKLLVTLQYTNSIQHHSCCIQMCLISAWFTQKEQIANRDLQGRTGAAK
jgi:hypothetical protein